MKEAESLEAKESNQVQKEAKQDNQS